MGDTGDDRMITLDGSRGEGGGSFRTFVPTCHLLTNAELIRRFLPVEISVRQVSANDWYVQVYSR